jgi:Na+-transporting methylmalonyl-CoA/oxaloacetate decarboxylase beta subunit
MGCGASKIDLDEKYAVEQNLKIERRLRQDKKLEARTVKILLLGMWAFSNTIGTQ